MEKEIKRNKINWSKFSTLGVLIILIVVSSLINKSFLSMNNILNIAKQLAVPILLAYGAMILVISGMIDLSAGSVLALSGVLSVAIYKSSGSLALAVLVAIGVGVLFNIINAVMAVSLKVPAFIATLGVQMVARGLALYYTNGQNILQIGDYTVFGQGFVGVIPISVIITLVITFLIYYLMKHTKLGRSFYAVGSNSDAAVASGIEVKKSLYKAFIINGILVGIAGIIFMSRVNAGLPNGAVGYEMEGLTATIVGGTSFTGGVGSTSGTLIGGVIIGVLNNIMNLVGVNSYVQQMARGFIIAFAVIWDINTKGGKGSLLKIFKSKK